MKFKRLPKIVMAGPFPPPTHGVSFVNQNVFEFFCLTKHDVERFSTSRGELKRSMGSIAHRLKSVFLVSRKLVGSFFTHEKRTLYISLSGGNGLLFDLAVIAIARITKCQIILHHHSFNYIDNSSIYLRIIQRITSKKSKSIFLSKSMAVKFNTRYSGLGESTIVSNAAFGKVHESVARQKSSPNHGLIRIGLLSNLSVEKGLEEFLDIAEAVEKDKRPFQFLLAGPFMSLKVEEDFLPRINKIRCLKYLGPIYGSAKEKFYQEIDLFLFPTKYSNEAEPIVVLDALSFGRPVITYNRGCLGEILEDSGGLVYPRDSVLGTTILDDILIEYSNIEILEKKSHLARERYMKLHREGLASLDKLVDSLEQA